MCAFLDTAVFYCMWLVVKLIWTSLLKAEIVTIAAIRLHKCRQLHLRSSWGGVWIQCVCIHHKSLKHWLWLQKWKLNLPMLELWLHFFTVVRKKILRSFIFYSVDVFIYLGEIENTSKVCTNQEKIKSVLNPSMKASTSTVSCSLLCQ